MSTVPLRYRFTLPDSSEQEVVLELDKDTAELTSAPHADPPPWTRLEFNQCTGCPLKPAESPHCPAAVHIAAVIDGLTELVSYDKVRVSVSNDEREVVATLSAQQGLASLMGLIMASS